MKPTCFFACLCVGAALIPFYAGSPAHAKPKPPAPKKSAKTLPLPPGVWRGIQVPSDPWRSADIGAVGVPGKTIHNEETGAFQITASGEDMFGKADSFRYVYQPLAGDGQIAAQVLSYERKDIWTKVGVMVRDSDAPGAKFADIVLTPDKGAEFQWRAGTDGETQTSDQTPSPAPYWVKLTRTGDVFVGWISPDGKTWTERGRATIAMGPNVLAGICVTSHKNDTLTEATVESVTVTAKPAPVK